MRRNWKEPVPRGRSPRTVVRLHPPCRPVAFWRSLKLELGLCSMFGAGESHAQNKPSVVHPSISSSKPRLGACMPIACPTRHWFSASIGADGASLFVRSLGFFFPVFVSTKRLPSFAEKSLLFRTRRNLCQQSSPSPLPALLRVRWPRSDTELFACAGTHIRSDANVSVSAS